MRGTDSKVKEKEIKGESDSKEREGGEGASGKNKEGPRKRG